MKKFLVSLMILSSMATSYASSIRERGSDREINFTRNGNQMVFTLKDNFATETLKILRLDVTRRSVSLRGDRDEYKFEILHKGQEMTKDAYSWCWTVDRSSYPEISPAMIGMAFLGAGIVATISLCAVVPAVPMILGIALAPVDGIITFADRTLDTEAIAARKFARLVQGKDVKASSKVFDTLINQITNL